MRNSTADDREHRERCIVHRTLRTPFAILSFALAIASAGCGAADDPLSDVETGSREQALLKADPDTVTVTLFSEAGLWGDRFTQSVVPGAREVVQFVGTSALSTSNMVRRTSSVTMTTGQRSASLILYSGDDWTGSALVVSCSRLTTCNFNLHLASFNFGDRTRSAKILVDAAGATGTEGLSNGDHRTFSQQVEDGWNANLSTVLGSHARADGPVKLTWKSNRFFTLHQDLILDSLFTLEYRAWLEYDVVLGLTSTGRPNVHVVAYRTWVESGELSANYKNELDPKVLQGEATLSSRIDGGLVGLPDAATIYIAPASTPTLSNFSLLFVAL